MKTLIILAAGLLASNVGYAESNQMGNLYKQEAQEREQRSNGYSTVISCCPITPCNPDIMLWFPIWTVLKGSETYTLDQFVSSGKFCKIYGHKWIQAKCPDCQSCEYCFKHRTRVRQSETWQEWDSK